MNIEHLHKICKKVSNAEVTANDKPIIRVERRFTEDKKLIINFVTGEPELKVPEHKVEEAAVTTVKKEDVHDNL